MIYLGRREDIKNILFVFLVIGFSFFVFAKGIFPNIIFKNQDLHSRIEGVLHLTSNPVCVLGIILFTYYTLELQKIKKFTFLGYLYLILIPCILVSILFEITNNLKLSQTIFVPISIVYGVLYWILLIKTYFSKENKNKKDKSKNIVFISISLYYIFYTLYAIGIFLKNFYIQMIFANTGFVLMTILSAYALAFKFNQEHKDLIDLSKNLELKVFDRTKQLEEASNQKTTFFINLTHETKTPLTLIANYLDKDIKHRGPSPEIKIVKQNVDKLLHNMVNFLDIEKLDKGQTFYSHKEVNDFSEILKVKLLMFNEIADKKNISITSDIEKNIFIKIDNYALDRIINNLIDNAIRYTEHAGNIEVALKSNNDKIDFIVKDTGIGIPENEVNNIFEPYYQISHNKRNVQGIGMGLSIVKKIITEVNGKIDVITKENEGSTFKITFDKHLLNSNDNIIKNNKHSSPVDDVNEIKLANEEFTEGRDNILIVEDNIEMLSYLQGNFKNDYNVFCSLNGKDALEKLENIPNPHIIIADIMMDKMDGYEFYDNIKKDNTLKNIPFIFLTAKSGADEKLKGLSKGAIDFIAKPFSIDELLIKVKNLMKNKIGQEKNIIESIYETTKKQLKEIKTNNINYDKLKDKYNLTNKEIEIIRLIQEKLTNKEIGSKLNKKEGTIKNHIQIIFEKLGINKRDEIIEILNMNQ